MRVERRLSLLYPWLVSFQPGKEMQSKRRGSYWWCGSQCSPWCLSEGRFVNEEREPPSQQTFSPSLSLLFFFSTSLTLPSCLCKAVCESECVCAPPTRSRRHPPSLPPSLLASLQPPQYSLVSRDIRVSQSLSQCVCETGEICLKSLPGHLCSHKPLWNQYNWL